MAGIAVSGNTLVIDSNPDLATVDDTIRFVNFDMKNGNISGQAHMLHTLQGSISTLHTITGAVASVQTIQS